MKSLLKIPFTSFPSNLFRRYAVALCAGVLFLLSSRGEAHAFGARGDFAVSAERMFGFYSVRREWDAPNGNNNVNSSSSIGFMVHRPASFLTTPRIAFDYFITNRLSLGGAVGLYSYNDHDNNNADDTGILFAPRVGYVIPFNQSWGFWPRGGLTFFSQDGPNRDHGSLTLEGLFFFMPSDNVGFSLGPVIELGFMGSQDNGNNSFDYNERVVGASAGLFVTF